MATDHQNIQVRPRDWVTPVALVILRQDSSYGYELMKRLEQQFGYELMKRLEQQFGFEQILPGTLYRTLRRMEQKGLCKSEWETSEGGPARRMYYITEPGESYLAAWAEECEQYQNVMDSFARAYRGR